MRYSSAEKLEIINLVIASDLGVKRSLEQLCIPRSTFYNWLDRYTNAGVDGLEDMKPSPAAWNKIPEEVEDELVQLALKETQLSPRELASLYTRRYEYFISESSVYRILKRHDLITAPAFILMKAKDKFDNPTTAINQLWQTDFTYFKIIGYGWFYLSTVLDDYSRYIIAWRLCSTMAASDVANTLEDALEAAGLQDTKLKHRPRLLSDNGPCYISHELADWLDENNMKHTRGKPYHPMTQGKIERYHRTMKNQVNLENYSFPEELERAIEQFVEHYNKRRVHESLNNLTPEEVYLGKGQTILNKLDKIKKKTMEIRKRKYYKNN